eukprot:TRINITY_DN17898_c0_g1_i5.p2 TRINITY_DN17898_c0_g1~~TRINITY_DN17898_c0_g1_i5.p2  ORF type:complete len:202 (+),score=-20.56 TRINITY_DN17898_c0_g1_i5:512-1117(+)
MIVGMKSIIYQRVAHSNINFVVRDFDWSCNKIFHQNYFYFDRITVYRKFSQNSYKRAKQEMQYQLKIWSNVLILWLLIFRQYCTRELVPVFVVCLLSRYFTYYRLQYLQNYLVKVSMVCLIQSNCQQFIVPLKKGKQLSMQQYNIYMYMYILYWQNVLFVLEFQQVNNGKSIGNIDVGFAIVLGLCQPKYYFLFSSTLLQN